MDFTFSEDQLLFQDSVRGFLVNEITPERLRAGWDTETGRDPALWQQLAELGLAAAGRHGRSPHRGGGGAESRG